MGKIKIIAAIGKRLELGKDNDLIWHFKDDMKFFKENTINHKVIMGYNTFKSLPGLLSKREHIVLSYQKLDIENVLVYTDFKELLDYIKSIEEDVYVIGGASIYKLFLDYADELILTEIDSECENAQVYFPEFNKDNYKKEVIEEKEENNIKYKFVVYRRVSHER